MTDLLGFGDAGASPVLTTTADVTSPVAGDTFSKDCTTSTTPDGTPWNSKWGNRLLQQVRSAIRFGGVPLNNAYDNMLSWAIQSGAANWIGGAGGTANALTGAALNSPIAVEAGTCIFGIASANNTGATTFNWSDLGADPLRDAAGVNLVGGELVNGDIFGVCRVAGHWRLITPSPISFILKQLYQIDIQTFDTTGTWISPPGFAPSSLVIAEMWGGGGGGGGSGTGGGGGAYERYDTYLNLLPGSCTALVGPGGLGSDNSSGAANTATQGGQSVFAYGLYGNSLAAIGGNTVPATPYTMILAGAGPARIVTPYTGNGGVGGLPGTAPYNGGNAIFGGAGGAGWNGTSGAPGTSVFGGAAGAVGAAGSAPGGGGGAGGGVGALGGAGAHGRIRVTTIQG